MLLSGLPWVTLGASAAEPEEWQREAGPELFYVPPLDERGHPTHVVLRIVDDVTGEGIPGATAALHAQSEHPITGLVAADRTAIADEEGWVRVRADDLGWEPTWTGAYWTYVEAPGYGGVAVTDGRIEGVVRLSRARSVLVQVRDALDRPVVGATLGARSSRTCGHMPDQRVAVTDLAGVAVLSNLGPEGADNDAMGWECWVAGETIAGEYHDILVSDRWREPQILRHFPSQPIEGTVLDAEGKPVVGAHVGTLDGGHRGPWTTSGPGGHFRLVGAEAFVEMIALRPRDAWENRLTFCAPPPGVKRLVTLPPEGSSLSPPTPYEVEITLEEPGSDEDVDPRAAGLVAVREGDGWTVEPSGWGRPPQLPAGTWTLSAGGGLSPFILVSTRLTVPDHDDGESPRPAATLRLVRQPPLRVALEGDPATTTVWLVSATEQRWIPVEELVAGTLAVPTDVACAFRLQAKDGEEVAFVPVAPGPRAADAAPLVLRAPRPLTVKAALVGPDGAAVAGWLSADAHLLRERRDLPDWEPEDPATREPSIAAWSGATLELLVVPEPATLLPRVLRVPVPAEARERGTLDLGSVALEPRGDRRLLVVDRAGAPLAPYSVRVLRGDVVREWTTYEEGVTEVDPRLTPFTTGDVVEVDAPWEGRESLVRLAQPVRRRLEGPGPWTVRPDYPTTTLVLEATDEEGRALDATLLIDGTPHEFRAAIDDDGAPIPCEVTGIAAGTHRLAVAAENRLTQLHAVTLREGERRVVKARLRAAPRPGTAAK